MLESLTLKNFTAFGQADFKFADGVNVIVGENATGKTHILKLAYSCAYVFTFNEQARKFGVSRPTLDYFKTTITQKLLAVFKPDSLGGLVRRRRSGKRRAEVGCEFSTLPRLQFSLTTDGKSGVNVDRATWSTWLSKLPVYLPTHELLTIYPGFVPLYETTHLQFDETWRDTCILLGGPLVKGPREKRVQDLLRSIEQAMDGRIKLSDAGRFYLSTNGVDMEMHLVAEGWRKLAMIAQLIATGALGEKGLLFWDEPEVNLNPKITKLVTRVILHLCQSGIQVFVASHSLFLLRELDILLHSKEFKNVPRRFFGLHKGDNEVFVMQGDSIDDIGEIAALQEELSQSDRFLESEAT